MQNDIIGVVEHDVIDGVTGRSQGVQNDLSFSLAVDGCRRNESPNRRTKIVDRALSYYRSPNHASVYILVSRRNSVDEPCATDDGFCRHCRSSDGGFSTREPCTHRGESSG